MREMMHDALETLAATPPSDYETVSLIRQAIANRAKYFTDADPDVTRGMADHMRSTIYERFNVRDEFEQQAKEWGDFYESHPISTRVIFGDNPALHTPTLQDFESHHVDIPLLEAEFLEMEHQDMHPTLVIAPVLTFGQWRQMMGVRGLTLEIERYFDTAEPMIDVAEIDRSTENHRTISHNGQLWLIEPAFLNGEDDDDHTYELPLPSLPSLLAIIARGDMTVPMPQLANSRSLHPFDNNYRGYIADEPVSMVGVTWDHKRTISIFKDTFTIVDKKEL